MVVPYSKETLTVEAVPSEVRLLLRVAELVVTEVAAILLTEGDIMFL